MYYCAMNLKELRKSAKISVKQTGLNARTVKKIETGNDSVSVKSLKIYLDSIGLKLNYSI